ncbi:MAG: VWA domain-containing protein [Candidatus Alcyoniella australis]|nr:VWA domain-containing protein [Candidatus Alcyoniella australis]
MLERLPELSVEARGAWLIGALVAAALLPTLVWIIAFRSRLSMSRPLRAAFAISRSLLLLLIAAALIQVVATRYEQRLEVALLVDASASVPDDQLAAAADYAARAYAVRGDAGARGVLFAHSPEVLGAEDWYEQIVRPEQTMSSDIARAVHATMELLPADATRRIVLLSDGNQTRGDLLAEARAAQARGIELYSVPLQTLGLVDAYIESLSLPRQARPGERVHVRVKVMSNFAGPAAISLSAGGKTQVEQVELLIGQNNVEFDFDAGSQGDQGVVGRVGSELDQVPNNNRLAGTLRVVSKPRALFVTENLADDAPLLAALEAEGLRLDVAENSGLPRGGLTPFDLVVLSSLTFEGFEQADADRLEDYLRRTGGGLLLIAGEDSQILGEEEQHPIEPLLPVEFKLKKKTEPNPVELVILIDKSASMARQNKFGLAQAAVEQLLNALPERSRVSVILFDDLPYVLFGLTDIEQRELIRERLYKLGTDGGTSIYPGLRRAYGELRDSEARVKHVILLTDGISTTRFEHNGDIVEGMARKEITVSTVAVGRESDREHLRTIARYGQGRFYYIEDPESIPDILLEETKTVTRTNIVEDTFEPELLQAGEMFDGLDLEPLPELRGYNSAESRPTSETYLLAKEREPLLSRWSLGLGKVTVFCADLRGQWSADWLEWDRYGPLVGRMARHTMRDRNLQNFAVTAQPAGQSVRVAVDATDAHGDFINNMPLQMDVVQPDLTRQRVELIQDRPGGYSGEFPHSGFGGYTISVRPQTGELRSEGIGRVQLEPPGEFVKTQTDRGLLRALAQISGGKFDPPAEEVFEPGKERFPDSRELWPYLLYAALAMVLLGTVLRRI